MCLNPGAIDLASFPRLPTGRGDVMVRVSCHGLVESMAAPAWLTGVTGT
jgi:hypothetical protein